MDIDIHNLQYYIILLRVTKEKSTYLICAYVIQYYTEIFYIEVVTMHKPQVYLLIKGNCGNQFFQYAFARNIQERLGADLIIDYSAVRSDQVFGLSDSDNLLSDYNTVSYQYLPKTDWSFSVLILVVKLLDKIVGLLNLKPYSLKKYNFYLWCAKHLEKFGLYYFLSPFFEFKYPAKKKIVISGYFESAEYFKDIDKNIKKELLPKKPLMEQNISLYDAITQRESVCITIKRMDVENSLVNNIYAYSIDYFYNAIDFIRSKIVNPVFIIFSDNVEWCKENFHVDGDVYYETPNNPIGEKIRLMSSCKHFIIHNSTFSWWVQHISQNDNKIVIAPTKWLNSEMPIDIYEKNWIFMTNEGEIKENHD